MTAETLDGRGVGRSALERTSSNWFDNVNGSDEYQDPACVARLLIFLMVLLRRQE